MTRKKSFFRQGRILVFLITFVCVFALVGTGADVSKKVVKCDERVIELANSPVRILLKGNQTYRIGLDGKNYSRELPQRHEIMLRRQAFDPLVNPPQMAEVTKTRYSLWVAKKNKTNEVADFITGIGGDGVLKGKSRRMEANLNGNQLRGVAANPWVLAIDRWTPYEEDMNNARDIGGADYLETVQGYTGQGVRAEVCDGGLRTTHVDFQANPPLINAGNSSSTSHSTHDSLRLSIFLQRHQPRQNPDAPGMGHAGCGESLRHGPGP